jgi:hypothetical protein
MVNRIPDHGRASIGGIELPYGHQREGNRPWASGPVLWATDEAVDDFPALWPSLRPPARARGLVPLLLSGLGGDAGERPWDSAEFSPGPVPTSGDPAAADLLAEWWADSVPDPEEDEEETAAFLAPFTRQFPGMAAAESRAVEEAEVVSALSTLPAGRLGLVAADRPADCLAVLGWHGAANYDRSGRVLSVVLRSWEERFGASLVALGFDTVVLLVERPPQTAEAAERVAAEHFAFCPDTLHQGVGSIRQLADDLLGGPVWAFWWD